MVEIAKHDQTKPEVVDATFELMREAFSLLKEGIASAEDIDLAVAAGPGFRWAFNGPIEISDLGGLDTWQKVFDNIAPHLD